MKSDVSAELSAGILLIFCFAVIEFSDDNIKLFSVAHSVS